LSGTVVTIANSNTAMATFMSPLVALETLVFQLAVTDDLGLTSTGTLGVTVTNQLPVAAAGGDQSVWVDAVVTLDGSGSSDADGPLASYLWSQTGGAAVTLTGTTSAMAIFTAPAVVTTGTFTFDLIVTDSVGATDTDTVIITVTNTAPVAVAGDDQAVGIGAAVTLDGSASSDVDGNIVSYLWTQTAGALVTLTDTTSATATFTSPLLVTTDTLTFTLTVTDNGGATHVDTINIVVTNNAPVAAAGNDQNVTIDMSVTLDGSGSSDADGAIVSYLWVQTSGTVVTVTGSTLVTATFTAPIVATTDTLTFDLTVTDNGGATHTDAINVTVTNQAPVADAGLPQTVRKDDVVMLDGSASVDPDGMGLTFSWLQTGGLAVTLDNTGISLPSFTAPTVLAVELLTFELTVSDGGITVTDTVVITVNGCIDGDLNCDGVVNIVDLNLVLSHFGQISTDGGWDPFADSNGDGVVNIVDLNAVLSNFGATG
jgi:hypothetical protein